jgi:hypothetical protein
MIQSLLKRFFHIKEMIFLLSLSALICLPTALSEIVRDAGVSLLLPLTLAGAILAWMLVVWDVRKLFSGIVLLVIGPLVLYVRIGQLGDSALEFVRQLFALVPALLNKLFYETPLDASIFISSKEELMQKVLAFTGRISLWFTGIFQGVQIEDPVVRTLIWSMGLWLIAVWAGWQIFRNKRFMLGILPSTVLLAFVLDYTGEEKSILWIHLALFLFLVGLTNYQSLQSRWVNSNIDYAESTSIDTLVIASALTLGLVSVSFLVSTFSVKDILDDFRERRQGLNESQAQSLGLESAKDNFQVTGFSNGLPRSYLLNAGPELSTQLAMTISTGDLPPMPESARPIVPRYYWRTLTYSIYTGAGWTNPSVEAEDVPANQPILESINPNQRIIHAQVTFRDNVSKRLYWTGTLVSADVPFKAAWNQKSEDKSMFENDLLAALAPVETYTVESILLNVSADDLRDSPSVYPNWVRNQFLPLPDSVPERVLALARDLTASEPNAYDRAIAIQNYLREFPYTLDIDTPPSGRDIADYFLFDLQQGYCDYYATSMAVLARAAGLPARLVVGYANGRYDVEKAQYIVTENYAHSWVEIYFANIGWVEFEPTASQPVIYYEDINETAATSSENIPAEESLQEKLALFFQRAFQNIWSPVVLIFVCVLLWIGLDSLRLHRMDPSQTIHLLYKRLRRLARPVSGYASKSQTLHNYADNLIDKLSALESSFRLKRWLIFSQREIDELTQIYSRSLFTSHPLTKAQSVHAIKLWSRLRWRLILAIMMEVIIR